MRCTQPLFSTRFGVVSVRCEGFRVTPRDREIVRWIGRHRMVTAGQVARQFELGRSQCYARLTGLARLGLVSHQRLLYGQPGVYLATRAGLDAAGVSLPAATVDLRTYEHDLGVVSLVSDLEQAARGEVSVLTERELRAVDAPATQPAGSYQPRFAVLLGQGHQLRLTPSGAPRVHFADAVLVDQRDRITAIELELTAKGRSRLRGILRAYIAARHLTSVRYYVRDVRVRDLVSEEVSSLRAEQIVDVRQWGRVANLQWRDRVEAPLPFA